MLNLGADLKSGTQRELVLTREIGCPRATLFRAWTDPERLVRWWGPTNFTTSFAELDLRPGGTYRIHMRSPGGEEFLVQGQFREIADSTRLAFTWCDVEDAAGNSRHETIVTVTFAEHQGRTQMTLHQGIFDSEYGRDAHWESWNESIERLVEYAVMAAGRRQTSPASPE